jgi:glutamate 5-kinase
MLNTKKIKRVVIKIGSNVLTDEKGVRKIFLKRLAQQITFLHEKRIDVVLVSSGAIAAAMAVLDSTRPQSIPEKQAYAAIGQPMLIHEYSKVFAGKGVTVAQILLTQDGLEHRERFMNAKHTIQTLLAKKVVPIINENDSVAVAEIKIGDNDHLSAHVACLLEADLLIILSDVDGLYDGDPSKKKDVQLISQVESIGTKVESYIYTSKEVRSVGGMQTKLQAAKICTGRGISVVITNGLKQKFIETVFQKERKGTLLLASDTKLSSRKHWIGHVQKAKGKIVVDKGAVKAVLQGKKSLLPSGIKGASGKFQVGDCIDIVDDRGKLLGRGLSGYSWKDVETIKGCKSQQIQKLLGYKYGDAVVHRDDLVIL